MAGIAASDGLVINVTYDASVAEAPTGFVAAFDDVVAFCEQLISNPVTINIQVGYGELAGESLVPGALGENLAYLAGPFTYGQVRAALDASANSAADATALASLGSVDPTAGGSFLIPTAEAKVLGLIPASSALDGYVGFSGTVAFAYDSGNRAVAGEYDFIGTAEHELSEVLGRVALLGGAVGSIADSYSALDLFRYSAPGVRQLVGGQPGYFSIDGGVQDRLDFNQVVGGDFGDWAGQTVDSFNAFNNPGSMLRVSATDVAVLDALGYDIGPMVIAVAASPGGGDLGAGQVVALTLTFSTPMTVSGGTPTLVLNDGGTAVYDAAESSAAVLAFDYTVAPGQRTPTLAVTAANLNGAAITDAAGDAADLSGAAARFPLLHIDTMPAPTPTGLALSPASDSGVKGDGITSEPTPIVTGNGEPGDVVALYAGAAIVGTGTVAGNGSWSIATTPLPLGPNLLTATQTEASGNASLPSAALLVLISENVFTGTYDDGIVLTNFAVENAATIAAAALVANAGNAVLGLGHSWTVTNLGTVAGGGVAKSGQSDGLYLAGGNLTNQASGMIAGAYAGVEFVGPAGSVTNFGSILGAAAGRSDGIRLADGGAVVNGSAEGTIRGSYAGVDLGWGGGTVVNFGTIAATDAGRSYGVVLRPLSMDGVTNSGLIEGGRAGLYLSHVAAAAIVNDGTIVGQYGILSSWPFGQPMVVNGGTIIGSGGTAVAFANGSGHLVVEPGAAFGGVAAGNGSTLELAAGPQPGTLSGLGTNFLGFSQLIVDPAAAWQLSGAIKGGTVANDGTVAIGNGGSLALGPIGAAAGQSGVIAIGGNGVADLAGAVAGQTVLFAGASGLLLLDDPFAFAGSISGFQSGDAIALAGIAATGYRYAGGVLSLVDGAAVLDSFNLSTPYEQPVFGLAAAVGATLVTVAPKGGNLLVGSYPNGIVLGNPPGQQNVTVAASGYITNRGAAVSALGGSGWNLTNLGKIAGLGATGAVHVATRAAIAKSSGVGVHLIGAGSTLTNAGTIAGASGNAVLLAGGHDLLAVAPGAVFAGSVVAHGGGNTLELTVGPQAGTVAELGTLFAGFATLRVDAAAAWRVCGDGGRLVNDGTIAVRSGTLSVASIRSDAGKDGVIAIANNGIAEVRGAVAAAETMLFTGNSGVLQLDQPAGFAGTVAGFRAGDAIDLAHLQPSSLDYDAGVLSLFANGNRLAEIAISGNHTDAQFALFADNHGGTEIALTGTR